MATMTLEPQLLASIAIRSCFVLILTACIAFALRRRSAAVLHAIWTAGLGGSLAAPLVMVLSPSWSLPMLSPEEIAVPITPVSVGTNHTVPTTGTATPDTIGNERSMTYAPLPTTPPTAALPPATIHVACEGVPSLSTVASKRLDWPTLATVATALWAIGLLAILLRLLQQTIAVQRRVHRASDLHSVDWNDQRDTAAQLLGLQGQVALKRCSEALSPMVAGVIKPVVLLPNDADRWSKERRKLVLLHELAHVQRRDVLTQMMATLACAVNWFNPLAWCGAIQMKRLREIACDDAVVTHSSVPANYAQTLLDVAKRYHSQPLTIAVAMTRSSNVERRIAAILSSTPSRRLLNARSVRAFAATALLLSACVGTCQLSARAHGSTEDDASHVATAGESTESRTMRVAFSTKQVDFCRM